MLGSKLLDSKLLSLTRGVSRWGAVCGVFCTLVFLVGCPGVTPPTSCTEDSECDNGDFCDGAETCVDGACADGTAPCTEDQVCDEETDTCADVCTDDAGCDDGDACNGAETCVDGACVAGTDVDCDDGDACTTDTCDSATGDCSNAAVECPANEQCNADTGACEAIPCTTNNDCDDSDLCTDDACVNSACQNTAVDCDDGNACTTDSCDAATGDCANEDVVCDEGTCDPDTGECSVTACTEDADCDDDLFCTGTETCTDGNCVAGDDPCADTVCQDQQTIACTEGDTAAVCSCEGDVEKISFTLDQDNLTGTTGDDEFEANLLFNSGSGTSIASLQTGDSANGLAGTDTLDATVSGTAVVPTLSGIENMNITAFAATTLTATNISGVDELISKASTANLTINSLQEHTNIGMTSVTDGASDLLPTFATAVTTGTADNLGITITGSQADIINVTTGDTNGFETVSIASNGSTANVMNTLTQTTGTSMKSATITGTNNLQWKVLPDTILTYDASVATGDIMLGSGTSVDGGTNYTTFATMNLTELTTGSGDDTIIFAATLDTNDADGSGEDIDLGEGTDVVQASFGSSFGTALPFTNVEEFRFNATANSVSLNLTSVAGLTDVTNEQDGTANTVTLLNVAGLPNLNFRGNNTQAAQTYDTVTYTGSSLSGSSDTLNINVNNRGTALNASGTTNEHTVGAITAANIEIFNITVADGPATFGGMTAAAGTTFTFTADSNLTLGTVTGATAAVTSVNTSGVTGNLSATFSQVASGVVTLGNGTNTVTLTNSSGTITVNGGTGADTITGGDGAEVISGGSGADVLLGEDGVDTINGGADADTITTDDDTAADADADTVTTGTGADTVVLKSVAADSTNADTVSDFTAGASGDQFDLDLSSLEASGAIRGGAVIDFVVLGAANTSVADTDATVITECSGACTPAATANVLAIVTPTYATTALLQTGLEAGGGSVLTIDATASDVGDAFTVVYADGTDAWLAVCYADTETTADTDFEAGDLTCVNVAKMSGNAGVAASEFNVANFDYIP